MITAMIGHSLISAFADGDTNKTSMTIGVLLMMCSGIAVVGIGLLMYQILKTVNRKLAIWYPILRVMEFMVSTICGIYLLITLQQVPNDMLLIYIPTGIGGLIFTYLLFVSKFVPRPIAVLGLVGYAMLLLGAALGFMGIVDMNSDAGMILLAPGGLFEFVFLPLWLIIKGFRLPPRQIKVAA